MLQRVTCDLHVGIVKKLQCTSCGCETRAKSIQNSSSMRATTIAGEVPNYVTAHELYHPLSAVARAMVDSVACTTA